MKLALAILALASPLALAQPAQQLAPQPSCDAPAAAAFDVASVKPSDRPSGSVGFRSLPDSLTASGTVFHMIEFAYNLHDFQIAGGPGWVTTATWEVSAKVEQPPADWTSLSNEARNAIHHQRMAAVLVQRFGLKCHFETKQLPVYNLVLAKAGAKLTATPADAATKGSFTTHGEQTRVRMDGAGATTSQLAANLTRTLGRAIIDKTGLPGNYDFTLTYAIDTATSSAAAGDSAPDAASGPTIFTAIEEQLGLKLESAKGPVPVLVIDSIDRPSEN
jgi:uncharacterized protein (TIGR03435 family)